MSSSIAINDPLSSAFNGQILYGTCTDFEFGHLEDHLEVGRLVFWQHR
jgi:hypothetical protein